MLTRWLPPTENKLPPNASHQVGVGAFVMNERREVLVVQVSSWASLCDSWLAGPDLLPRCRLPCCRWGNPAADCRLHMLFLDGMYPRRRRTDRCGARACGKCRQAW